MSSEATTEIGGENKTAWAYRIMYLNEKIEFKSFYCPYCEIPLHSRNINVDGEIIRPPHFYISNLAHIDDCNGEAIYTENSHKKIVKNTTLSKDMKFPQGMVQRPPQKEGQQSNATLAKPIPITLDEIRRRRVSTGSKGRPKATSYLLQAFVEAKTIVIKKAFDAFPDKLKSKERSKAIEDALLEMPLKLDDDTNYKYAFRTLAYPYSKRRIYEGIAKVFFSADAFILQGKSLKKSASNEVDFSIFIPTHLLHEGSPRYHNAIMALLAEGLDAGVDIKFSCFGLAVQSDNNENEVQMQMQMQMQMQITSLDYIYLTKPYSKK